MKAFSDIVLSIYDAALTPENWPAALSRIGALFDAEGAVIIFYTGTVPADFIYPPEMAEAVRVYVEEEWWRRDIHAQRALERHMASGDVLSDFTVATAAEIENLPIYVDFFPRVGFGWLMSSILLPDLDMLVALSTPRAKSKGPFSAEEMDTLRALGRHVEQALRISLRIANLDAAQAVLVSALDTVAAGIFALDRDERLALANRVGREQIPNHFALVEGRLTPPLRAERPAFAALLAAAAQAGRDRAPPRSCVLTGQDGRKVAVWALPTMGAGQGRIGMPEGARILVLALPMGRDRLLDPAVLRDVFDLSLGEARLASLIGGGLPVREAADRLGVAEGTARVVLKRVFRKIGVNRQAELVLQLSSLGGLELLQRGPAPDRLG